MSEEIAHQGIATATPTFAQRLQSIGYTLLSPDTTPNRLRMQIVSLFDYTGEALKPWAEAGYECFAYDIQHAEIHRDGISFLHADLHDSATVRSIVERHSGKVRLVSAFPVCTDLAASGACWWAGKREADPQFQERAARRAV